MAAPSLAVLKARLDEALSSLLWWKGSLPVAQMIYKVPSNPNHMILWPMYEYRARRRKAACLYKRLLAACVRLWLQLAFSYEASLPLTVCKAVLLLNMVNISRNYMCSHDLAYTWIQLSVWGLTNFDVSFDHRYHSWCFYPNTLVPEPYFFMQVEKFVRICSTPVYSIVQLPRWEGESTCINMCFTVVGKIVQGCIFWVQKTQWKSWRGVAVVKNEKKKGKK